MNLDELQHLMNDKKAMKTFMSKKKNTKRRILYDTLDSNINETLMKK